MKKRILTIVGARPQFIKAAVLSKAIINSGSFEERILHTGQHFDQNMSQVFFDELKMPKPTYELNIHGGGHSEMTGRMMIAIEKIITQDHPDLVLVYGDTNSTLAGALAASKLHIPVVHVEAGLRSYNKLMPEELNRVLTDHVSTFLFCPTHAAVQNLLSEGITKGVYHTGDIMYDATLYALELLQHNTILKDKFTCLPEKFAFMTIHRAESTTNIVDLQARLDYAARFSHNNGLKIILQIHPRIRTQIVELKHKLADNFILTEPLGYLDTQYLLSRAEYVLTDSGGLQKEAYFHKVPCITLRSETEWVETIHNGWNRLWNNDDYTSRQEIPEYGNGKSAYEMLTLIEENI